MSVVIPGAGEARNNAINTVDDQRLQECVDRINECARNGKFQCTIIDRRWNTNELIAVGEALRDYGYEYSIRDYDESVEITISWFKAPYDK